MSGVVLFYSKHGATREIAERVARESESTLQEIKRGVAPPEAETLAIGVPIYAGTAPRPCVNWLEFYRSDLLNKRIVLFVSSLSDGAKAEAQLADGVPAWLVAHASETFLVGGRVRLATLGAIERFIMKRVAAITTDVDRLNEAQIDSLIRTLR